MDWRAARMRPVKQTLLITCKAVVGNLHPRLLIAPLITQQGLVWFSIFGVSNQATQGRQDQHQQEAAVLLVARLFADS